MHFPEDKLMTYLRVFLPEARIDDILDEIAQAAIESDVVDEIEFFSLAHWLMDVDDRRSDEIEAVVLVEEVGMSVAEVAIVLDLAQDEVEAAVAQAWDEVADAPEVTDAPAVADEPEVADAPLVPAVADDAGVQPGEAAVAAGAPHAEDADEDGASSGTWSVGREGGDVGRRRLWRRITPVQGGVAVAIVALTVLGVAVFSAAGRARLLAQGFDPLIAFGVVVGLLVGGAALVRATREPGPARDEDEEREAAGRA